MNTKSIFSTAGLCGSRAMLTLLLLVASLLSTSSLAQDRSLQFGMSFGPLFGQAKFDDDNSGDFNDIAGTGIFFGFLAEKPISDLFALSAEVRFLRAVEIGDIESTASGVFAGIGGIIGQSNKPRSFYASGAVGYSYVDLSDAGEMSDIENCTFLCFDLNPFRPGGHAQGLGFRVAAGMSVSRRLRLEVAYLGLGGDTSSAQNESALAFNVVSLAGHVKF